jgi:hypothetical protein
VESKQWHLKTQAFRHHLFTLVALLGCAAPFITPRHFPVHQLPGTQEPVVMSWVAPAKGSAARTAEVADRSDMRPRQLGGQLARTPHPVEVKSDLSRAQCILDLARSS